MGDNILDNCDFKINQRNVSGTISDPGYFVDRWKLIDGEVIIEEDGIRLNGTIVQPLENPIDGPTIASVFFDNGIMAASYDNSENIFEIKANGQLLKMAKLEIGNRQTLARQENGHWVLNDPPPNQEIELAKCRRFYVRYFRNFSTVGIGFATNATQTSCFFNLPPMRTQPTVSFKQLYITGSGYLGAQGKPVTSINSGQNKLGGDYGAFYATAEASGGGLTAPNTCILQLRDSGCYFIADADL